MKISELKPRQGDIDITVEVVSIEESREFQKFGKAGKVANATVKDSSGQIKLTLWNEDISKVKPGTKIKITNGFTKEFQGEMQLTAGRFGKLEILKGSKAKELKATEKIEHKEPIAIEDELSEEEEEEPEEEEEF